MHLLAKEYGQDTEIELAEFFEYGLRAATGYSLTMAGTAAQVADRMEEMFEVTGSRGGFMISVSQASARAIPYNLVTQLVPELQRRGRYRSSYEGHTLREISPVDLSTHRGRKEAPQGRGAPRARPR